MNLKIFGKVLLSVYRYLETITNAIENLVNKTTVNSMFRSQYKNISTLDLSNKLIDLIQRKERLINLKLICEKSLVKLSDREKRVLSLVYLDGVTSRMIAKLLNVSIRTVFRVKDTALSNFAFYLEKNGYDKDYFTKNYSEEKWLFDYYSFTSKGYVKKEINKSNENIYVDNDYNDDEIKKGEIISSILNQIKRTFNSEPKTNVLFAS